jgi:hypothetical protein
MPRGVFERLPDQGCVRGVDLPGEPQRGDHADDHVVAGRGESWASAEPVEHGVIDPAVAE